MPHVTSNQMVTIILMSLTRHPTAPIVYDANVQAGICTVLSDYIILCPSMCFRGSMHKCGEGGKGVSGVW